jgi:hypothetical protein
MSSSDSFVAFRGTKLIATGDYAAIIHGIFREGGDRRQGAVLVFHAATSQPLELDLRGTEAEALARVASSASQPEQPEKRGPGRPRLGVVARELTLLPRHWDWLNAQSGGASAAVRRLVDQARAASDGPSRGARRIAQESAYRFMSAMAGDQPGFESATRALFAHDAAGFDRATDAWPSDLRAHARRLAGTAFANE